MCCPAAVVSQPHAAVHMHHRASYPDCLSVGINADMTTIHTSVCTGVADRRANGHMRHDVPQEISSQAEGLPSRAASEETFEPHPSEYGLRIICPVEYLTNNS